MENRYADSFDRQVSSKHHPSFFQVYLQENNSSTLRIPSPFLNNFNGNIPKTVLLKNISGMTWLAKCEFLDYKLHITAGWKHYVRDHNLISGEFLVFQYLHNSTFLVIVFGHDGCMKQEPLANTTDRRTRGLVVPTPAVGNMRFQRIFRTKFKNFVTVPKRILNAYVLRLPQKIKLLNEKGRGVRTQLRKINDRVIVGCCGVIRFLRMNKVQMGNKLEFEFVRGDGNTIKEIIVRNLSQELKRGY